MADPTNKAFRWENFFVSFELILVNLVFGYVILFYLVWLWIHWPHHVLQICITFYARTIFLEMIHIVTLVY
jgi:hypothetical protein